MIGRRSERARSRRHSSSPSIRGRPMSRITRSGSAARTARPTRSGRRRMAAARSRRGAARGRCPRGSSLRLRRRRLAGALALIRRQLYRGRRAACTPPLFGHNSPSKWSSPAIAARVGRFLSSADMEEHMRSSALARLIVMGVLDRLRCWFPWRGSTSIVSERANRRDVAVAEIGATWGGPQTIGGLGAVGPIHTTWIGQCGPGAADARACAVPAARSADHGSARHRRHASAASFTSSSTARS